MGETTASHLSFYTSLVEVASLALGGGKDKNSPGPITEDLSGAPPEHFQARMSQLLSL